MNRRLFILCTFLLFLCVFWGCRTLPTETPPAQHTTTATTTATTTTDTPFHNNIFPFIFSDDAGFQWFIDNVIGENDCKIGYLYAKDTVSGEITLLWEEPITTFQSVLLPTETQIFFVTQENVLMRLTAPCRAVTLYEAVNTDFFRFATSAESLLFFTDGDTLFSCDYTTDTCLPLTVCKDIDFLFPVNTNVLLWKDVTEQYYVYQIDSDTHTPTDEEWRYMGTQT